MANMSKSNDPRCWKKWYESGAIMQIRLCADDLRIAELLFHTIPLTSLEDIYITSPETQFPLRYTIEPAFGEVFHLNITAPQKTKSLTYCSVGLFHYSKISRAVWDDVRTDLVIET
jgi:hypothetical protein